MSEKKSIIVFGGGQEGRSFCKMVNGKKCAGLEQYEISYICDNHIKSGSYVEGIKVINAYELLRMKEKLDVYICSEKYLDEIMRQLYQLKIENDVYYVPSYVYRFKYNDSNMPVAVKMDIRKPRMPWLEIAIASCCNMNCNGCSTCANISEKEYIELEKFEKDMLQIKQKFSGIRILKLFGGEPLLHPQLEAFIEVARKLFPDTQLQIHSNGMLVPNCKQTLLDQMSKTNAKFIFTLYPETGKVKRLIEMRLQEANVLYEFTEPVYEFRKAINVRGDYDIQEVYANCCKCITLVKDKLCCGFPVILEKLEEKYGFTIDKDTYQNSVDIYHTELNGWEINRQLDCPYDLCAYCAFMRFNQLDEENYYFKWKKEKPELEDWLMR